MNSTINSELRQNYDNKSNRRVNSLENFALQPQFNDLSNANRQHIQSCQQEYKDYNSNSSRIIGNDIAQGGF